MLSLNPIIKLTLMIFAVIIAGSAVSLVFKNKIEIKTKSVYEQRSMLEVLGQRYDNYLLLKDDYAIVKEGLPLLKRVLPSEDKIDIVVADLDALATQTGNVQNLTFESLSAAQGAEGIKSIGFSASLTGSIGSFVEYFKKFQALPYFIAVDGFNINNSSGTFNNNSQLSFKAKLYIKN